MRRRWWERKRGRKVVKDSGEIKVVGKKVVGGCIFEMRKDE